LRKIALFIVLAIAMTFCSAGFAEEATVSGNTMSMGLQFSSNGDGTSTITGIGACRDKKLVIPYCSPAGETVTAIKNHAFYNVKSFDTLIFKNIEMEIGDCAFQSCAIEEIVIEKCELEFGEYAFAYCEDIEDVQLIDSTVEIGENVFFESGDGIDAVMNRCVLEFADNAFASAGIESLVFENTVFEAGKYAFAKCGELEVVRMQNCNANLDRNAFYCSGDDGLVIVRDSTLNAGDCVFESCGMREIRITESDSTFGEYAVSYCGRLESFEVNGGSFRMGENMFIECPVLSDVNIKTVSE